MPEPIDSGEHGLSWPESYAEILPILRRQWNVGGEIYLGRQLTGGRSGALVYTVDISTDTFAGQAILKLDLAADSGSRESYEAALHERAMEDAPEFAAKHLPRLLHSVHQGDQLAILSTIAGRGLEYAEPWVDCSHDLQLAVVKEVSSGLLEDWNAKYRLNAGMRMPQELLQSWLGYRLDPVQGGRIHAFLAEECRIPTDTPAIICDGRWYPNPLAFAIGLPTIPERARLRGAVGHCHCDFHGLNLLVDRRQEAASNYYLIDLALYKSEQFLFYDHAYFELALLLNSRSGASGKAWESVVSQLSANPHLRTQAGLRTEDIGLIELIHALRQGVTDWVEGHEADRLSFMENQALLARVAAGLSFAHKRLPLETRQMAYFYAASSLKDYLIINRIEWPKAGPEYRICGAGEADGIDSPRLVDAPAPAAAGNVATAAQAPPANSVNLAAHSKAPGAVDSRRQRQPRRMRRAAVVCAAVLALLFVTVLSGREFLSSRNDLSTASAPVDALGETNQSPLPEDRSATSLAVLPFTNLNTDADDGFSDGLSIDIASVFARTGLFKMPGMSSVFQYTGRLDNVRAIGRALNVDYLLEGTVLRNGDNLTIAVSLIRAEDGFLIWTQTFRETIGNVFVAQEEIAEAVGAELSTPLDVDADILKAQRTDNPRAYELFVRGLALLEHRGLALKDAMAVLERAVGINPDFAAAWGALSLVYNVIPTFVKEIDGRPVNAVIYYRKAKEAALKAQRIDPDLPLVRNAMGSMYLRERQWAAAEDAFQAALRNDPFAHRVMLTYAALLYTVGKQADAQAFVEQAREIDPLNELYNLWAAFFRWQDDQTEQNIKPLENIFRRFPQFREIALRIIIDHRAATGELDKARDLIEACRGCSEGLRTKALAMLDAATVEPAGQLFDEYKDANIMGYQFLYAVGGADVTLDAFRYYGVDANRRLLFFTVPWTLASVLAHDEAFFDIADDMGLVTYWRNRGWPDHCKPETNGRFTCS